MRLRPIRPEKLWRAEASHDCEYRVSMWLRPIRPEKQVVSFSLATSEVWKVSMRLRPIRPEKRRTCAFSSAPSSSSFNEAPANKAGEAELIIEIHERAEQVSMRLRPIRPEKRAVIERITGGVVRAVSMRLRPIRPEKQHKNPIGCSTVCSRVSMRLRPIRPEKH